MLQSDDDPRLDIKTPLHPADAVAAIITVEGAYLLQLRDNKYGIFFPAHWGCFGGAIDAGESNETAFERELHEELGLSLTPDRYRLFASFDFAFEKMARFCRHFYEIELTRKGLDGLRLEEGSAMRLFPASDILTGAMQMTPYDSFALWFHINRGRLHG
jgi:8-oxo-dGTP pyrophosphatase MutT (NUDIX family)